MALHIQRDPASDEIVIRFALARDTHDGPISVVGTFNDWTPGTHTLEPDSDGTRSVTVVLVTTGEDVHFRYLGAEGFWFDDPDADEITEYGSVLRLAGADGQHSDDSPTCATPDAEQTSNANVSPGLAESDNTRSATGRARGKRVADASA